MANVQLHAAKSAKNDEFYTQYEDIEAEMNAYVEYNKNVFKDKVILCPCDDPEWSQFTEFFADRFENFGLKKLICTSYAKSAGNRQITDYERKSPQFDEVKHFECGKLFILDKDTNDSRRIDKKDIQWQYLEGDGDFRSEEVTRLRDEADFIITNPPFSLFREFLAWIMDGKKKFIIIGSMNAITYKEVFPLIRNNELWLGPGFKKGNAYFAIPEGNNHYVEGVYNEETKLVKFRNCGWLTNVDHAARHELLQLMTMADNLKYNKKLRKKLEKDYGKLEYPKYDNYDAIEVPLTEAIPSDYDGVMGVPISFLPKFCPEQFEIVAFRKGEDGKDLVFTREREFNRTFVSLFDIDCGDDKKCRRQDKWKDYLRQNNDKAEIEPIDYFFPNATNLVNTLVNDCAVNGKKTYVRILIRRRQDA